MISNEILFEIKEKKNFFFSYFSLNGVNLFRETELYIFPQSSCWHVVYSLLTNCVVFFFLNPESEFSENKIRIRRKTRLNTLKLRDFCLIFSSRACVCVCVFYFRGIIPTTMRQNKGFKFIQRFVSDVFHRHLFV